MAGDCAVSRRSLRDNGLLIREGGEIVVRPLYVRKLREIVSFESLLRWKKAPRTFPDRDIARWTRNKLVGVGIVLLTWQATFVDLSLE